MAKYLFLFALLLTSFNQVILAQGRVGIGTMNPTAMLAIDSGLVVDQGNSNGIGLESALTFGGTKLAGVGSNRTGYSNHHGLDLYTDGMRRLSIDTLGRVGIGIVSPGYMLHVAGASYFNFTMVAAYRLGVGISSPLYPLHVTTAYFQNNVGIGTLPSTYSLDVGGAVRIQNDVRINGILNPNNALTIGSNTTIQGELVVDSNKGIVRSSNSTQMRMAQTSVTLTVNNLQAGGSVDSGNLNFSAFSGLPQVFVGNMVSSSTGEWCKIVFVPFDITASSCKFRVFNHGESAVTGTVTYAVLLVGAE